MSLYICTLAEAKAELGLKDTTDDAVLTTWMDGLQGRFVDHLRRDLLRAERRTELACGDGGDVLLLKLFPVEQVHSIKCATDGEFEAANPLVEFNDFVVTPLRGKISAIGWIWPTRPETIQIVYTGGYLAAGSEAVSGATAMPAALRRAFLLQLGFEWRNRQNLGKQNVNAQGSSVQLAPAKFLPEVEDGLAPYRRTV